MRLPKTKQTKILASAAVIAIAALAAYATTSVTLVQSDSNTYTYRLVLTGTAQVMDFHLRPKGTGGTGKKKMKTGTVADPVITSTNPPQTRSNWGHTAAGTTGEVAWYTSDSTAGEQGDTDPANDPAVSGQTIEFTITKGDRANSADLEYWITNDGDDDTPGRGADGTRSGPVASVVITPGTLLPTQSSNTPLVLYSTEEGSAWSIVMSTQLSGTDPIGINRASPPIAGVSLSQATGTFGTLPAAPAMVEDNALLSIGALVPDGYEFYVVFIGKDAQGNEELWTDPIHFVVQ